MLLILLMMAQVASQPIIIREPTPPERLETRLSANCGQERFEVQWTVLANQDSSFDEVTLNGRHLPASEIDSLNAWKGERSIESVTVRACNSDGQTFRPYLLVKFGKAESLNLPSLQSFEIVGDRLVFEPLPS